MRVTKRPQLVIEVAVAAELSVLRDQLSQDQRQNAAVVQVTHLGLVVGAGVGFEGRLPAIVADRLDLDLLARPDRVDSLDREPLPARQPQRLQILSLSELEG